jgi:hypothetical protein
VTSVKINSNFQMRKSEAYRRSAPVDVISPSHVCTSSSELRGSDKEKQHE